MHNKITISVRLIAIATAGTALYALLPDFGLRYIWHTILDMIYGYQQWEFLAYFPVAIVFKPILPLLKLVSAYGLLQIRPWARKLAIGTLSFDFLIRFIGAIKFVILVMQYRNKPIPPIPQDAVVGQVISMWPSYIIALLCITSVFILIQPSVKRIFKENKQTND